jgi:hypothetical protein
VSASERQALAKALAKAADLMVERETYDAFDAIAEVTDGLSEEDAVLDLFRAHIRRQSILEWAEEHTRAEVIAALRAAGGAL